MMKIKLKLTKLDPTNMSPAPYVAKNEKVGSLNTVHCDVGSDNINNTVDTRNIILRVKPDLLSQLKSVAAVAA